MANYKILIVGDRVENTQTITRFFEESHPEYSLYQVPGESAAIKLTETVSFDLIFSDWDMPGISGIDLLRTFKGDIKTKHIPVIIFTGVRITSEELDTALAAGACDYIRKPIDPVELFARAHSALMLASFHCREIEKKNIELVEKNLILVKNNQFILEMVKKLNSLMEISGHSQEAQALLLGIIEEIDQKIKQDSWQHFEIAFLNVHSGFIKNMISQFPQLTIGELKHCILIKLGMNIKDMASLLYQSPGSLKVARSRLRKKLQISNDIPFSNFLSVF